jgi:hypothetical protein
LKPISSESLTHPDYMNTDALSKSELTSSEPNYDLGSGIYLYFTEPGSLSIYRDTHIYQLVIKNMIKGGGRNGYKWRS